MSELPIGWETIALQDIAIWGSGGTPSRSKPEYFGGDIPWVTISDLTDGQVSNSQESITEAGLENSAAKLAPAGSILVALYGSIGKLGIAANPLTTNQAIAYALPDRNAYDSKYLFNYLQLCRQDLMLLGTGVTQKNIYIKDIKAFHIPLAPRPEQTRIVAKLEELLSDIDAGVAELKAAQKKLVQYRQSLLKAAVDGSLTAEWRSNNPVTETGAELLERILKERRTRWETKQLAKFKEQGKTPPKDWQKKYPEPVQPVTTDLPELPNEWAWASVDQSTAESLIGLDRGQEQQSSSAAFGYIKMNNVSMSGNIDTANITRINASPEEVEKYSIALNDVLFNTRNSLELVGKTGLIRTLDGVTLYNNNLMRLRFDGVLKPAFACLQICGPEFRSRLEKVKKATTSVAAVYAKDLFPLAIAVPPVNEQIEILRILDLEMSRIDIEQSAIEHLFKQASAQRQNILRAAFAGQLVPQDPNDEPASVLLERIRAERATQAKPKVRGRKKVTG